MGENNKVRLATEVFDEWAGLGKDEGMEKGHGPAVEEMLLQVLPLITQTGRPFSALDVGCGNGWVTRQLKSVPFCNSAIGIDGAEGMIQKAKEIDPEGNYVHCQIMQWGPPEPVNLIHSMEVFYYLKDTASLLKQMYDWLDEEGLLVFGVDRYKENIQSHSWDTDVGCFMALHSEKEWVELVVQAGFEVINYWRAGVRQDWPGTLAIIGKKPKRV